MENESDSSNNFFDNVVEELSPQKKTESRFNFFYPFILGAVITAAVIALFHGVVPVLFFTTYVTAFFIASVFLTGIGGLSIVNKSGLFDVILFGFLQLGENIKYGITMKKDARVTTDFAKFKKKKDSKRKSRWSWVITGLIYFILALIILMYV